MEPSSPGRKPVQERSRERIARALEVTENLLVSVGPEATSIPEIARISGVPRASIYQFYPTKYALFSTLADVHLKKVAEGVRMEAESFADQSWTRFVEEAVRRTSAYYNANPAASILILGGPFSRTSYTLQEVTLQDIGHQVREFFARVRPELELPEEPDVLTIAVEIAFSCMKHSYFKYSEITDAMADQAILATVAYLRTWFEQA